MINTPNIPELIEPKSIDLALLEIQSKLVSRFVWLDHAFGKAQRLTKTKNNSAFKYPAVYVGKKEYLNIFPDSHIGNYSFFDVDDGQKVEHFTRQIRDIDSKVGLVFWFDLSKIYPNDWQQRNIENVKHNVLNALSSMTLKRSRVDISTYWEKADKIYPNYSITEIKNQFLMRPYGGFRVDFNMKYKHNSDCEVIINNYPILQDDPYEPESTSGNHFNLNTLTNVLAVYQRTAFTDEWIINLSGIGWNSAIVLDIVGYNGASFVQQQPSHKYEPNGTIKISFPFPSIGKVFLRKIL